MTDEPLCSQINALESPNCTDYHVFLVRGTDSPIPGHMGELMKLFCDGINGTCGFENVNYPARSNMAGKDAWCESAHQGAINGQKQMGDYANKCADSNLVLLGFSQGGSVGLDILGGGGGAVFECEQQQNDPLNRTEVPGSHIVAASVFGAVRRTGGLPFSVKDGKDFDGRHTRSDEQNKGLMEYADILRDYCNHGDYMCAVGSEPSSLEIHLNYFEKYQVEAADWLVKTAENTTAQKKAAAEANNNRVGDGDKDGDKSAASSVTFGSTAALLVASAGLLHVF
ncbi:carbohydrate esterase family 5 protein [Aaosphaeria arxii CBS 175.79]|uniref:Carbohydrate esterase family 5 protein n=1 Tax=Aaosphaeria arxii CBS 175.79 TaxID=1450172 RepID=A0A6A5X7M8_9PLEO|nr:carbohydrate esterase family 5 protein [Aaosphaeria arxii CBS 175.79]KAF2008958.1 carbohydrate esterase family 5 protein [Aaosphaeria arxii CBS 175.79]